MSRKIKMNRNAFSYTEIIIVVAIIALVATIATPFLSNFLIRNNDIATRSKLLGTIRKAQMYSITGKANAVWGICYTDNTIRLFTGTCETPDIKEDYKIPESISITGLNSTTFSKLRGEPSSELTINVQSNIESFSIELNEAGGLTIL